MGVLENKIDDFLKSELEEKTLEELFEEYDLSATEVVTYLYRGGQIDLSHVLEEQE